MSEWNWFTLDVNPQPWEIGPLGVGRRNGKMYPYVGPARQLQFYQEAVKEELQSLGWQGKIHDKSQPIALRFWFWRQVSDGANYADTTNLQKATEDALQAVMIHNDRDSWDVHSKIVAQGPSTRGKLVIAARQLNVGLHVMQVHEELPDGVLERLEYLDSQELVMSENVWGDGADDF
jgi:Holliday junction resolvase RusA-like endonuclease